MYSMTLQRLHPYLHNLPGSIYIQGHSLDSFSFAPGLEFSLDLIIYQVDIVVKVRRILWIG